MNEQMLKCLVYAVYRLLLVYRCPILEKSIKEFQEVFAKELKGAIANP